MIKKWNALLFAGIFLILFGVLIKMVQADAYVVVNNADNSIHTVAEKPNDVLRPGQSRYVIPEYLPGFDNQFHYWNPQSKMIMRKTDPQITAIMDNRKEKNDKYIMTEAAKGLILIERVEALDPNRDYTAEKQVFLDRITAHKKQ